MATPGSAFALQKHVRYIVMADDQLEFYYP